MNQRAQGTVEYLVIIAAVVALALFLVGTTSGIFSVGDAAIESSSKQSLRGASPFAILDWTVNPTGQMVFVLKNNSFEKIGLIRFSLSAADYNALSFGSILPGQEFLLTVSPQAFSGGCALGKSYVFKKSEVWIDYNTGFAQNLREPAPFDIAGHC